jgi:hypothetical protein
MVALLFFGGRRLKVSQEVVNPVKTGGWGTYHCRKEVDSGLRRNDGKTNFLTFCEFIKIDFLAKVLKNLIKKEKGA